MLIAEDLLIEDRLALVPQRMRETYDRLVKDWPDKIRDSVRAMTDLVDHQFVPNLPPMLWPAWPVAPRDLQISRQGMSQFIASLPEYEPGIPLENYRGAVRLSPLTRLGERIADQLAVLTIPEDEAALRNLADQWMLSDESGKSAALFGIPAATARSHLIALEPGVSRFGDSMEALTAHVVFQQTVTVNSQAGDKNLPVMGGSVVSHIGAQARAISATSSYLPPVFISPDGEPFSPDLAQAKPPDEIEKLAREAIVAYLANDGANQLMEAAQGAGDDRRDKLDLSDFRATTLDRVFGLPVPLSDARKDRDDASAIRYLAAKVASSGDDGSLTALAALARGVASDAGRLDVELRAALQAYASEDILADRAEMVPYRGEPVFALPFNGGLRLAYQVVLHSKTGVRTWRAMMDALTGELLGPVESTLMLAQVFDVAVAVVIGNDGLTTPTINEVDVSAVMTIAPHGGVAANVGALLQKAILTADEQAAIHVAFHAKSLVEHFVNECGVPLAQFATGSLHAVVHAPSSELTSFDRLTGDITFTHGNVLAENNKTIQNPGGDPEVVYHEVAHGLMWLLNRDPFDNMDTTVPFARALIEGYATYFARSMGDLRERRLNPGLQPLPAGSPTEVEIAAARTENHWAPAAFRDADWGDQWGLSRAPHTPELGKDRLLGSVYPFRTVSGLPVYDVGMVWARALWDIRAHLISKPGLAPDVAIAQADRLALESFFYCHGLISSFELAAEGYVETARRLSTALSLSNADIDEMGRRFAARGILARRGVQAVAFFDGNLYTGTDAGLFQHAAVIGNTPFVNVHSGHAIAALAASPDGQHLYVAGYEFIANPPTGDISRFVLRSRLYHFTSGADLSGDWTGREMTVWDETKPAPLSLCVGANGNVFVGTTQGVYEVAVPPANPSVSTWGASETGFVMDVLDVRLAGQDYRFVARLLRMRCRKADAAAAAIWQGVGRFPASSVVSSITTVGNSVFAATLDGTIRKLDVAPVNNPQWAAVAQASTSVIRLAGDGAGLLVGSDQGLWQWTAGGGLTQVTGAGVPAALGSALVTRLWAGNGWIMAGTQDNRVFARNSNVWAEWSI